MTDRLKPLLAQLATEEGLQPTLIDGVKLARSDHDVPRRPVLYEPSVFIVASGRKTGWIADRRFVYDPDRYLVLSVPLPFECETGLSGTEPFLGLSIRMDLSVIRELASHSFLLPLEANPESEGAIYATPIGPRITAAAVRLLECLLHPPDAAVLGPGIIREIAYHALCGPLGGALYSAAAQTGPATRIYNVLDRMHTRYSEPLNVPKLAGEIGMSVSAFHHHFKAITANSPLRYLKSVRLHKARLLILHNGLGAALAASAVGYESASQFSREFKRFFGHPPAEVLRRLQNADSGKHSAALGMAV